MELEAVATDHGTLGTRGPGEVPKPVRDWAALPGAAALLAAVRTKIEAGKVGDGVTVKVFTEHRDDVSRMLGLEWDLSGAQVTLRRLRAKLAGAGTDLTALLTVTGGPLRDQPTELRQAATRRQQLRERTAEILAHAGVPGSVAELAVGRRWLGGDLRAAELVAVQVGQAWQSLPALPGLVEAAGVKVRGLAEFAGQVLGDPHALDRDAPAGRALVRIAAVCLALSESVADVTEPALTTDGSGSTSPAGELEPLAAAAAESRGVLQAGRWRTIWARLGITCDQVSSTVLLLNLPLSGASPALAHVTATPGEPVWVTARMTAGQCAVADIGKDAPVGKSRTVLVCENPSVVEAAADAFGPGCPPLVCLYGRPSGAAWAVLDAVATSGAVLLVSTDRDSAGTQIAAEVARRYLPEQVAPWLPAAVGLFEEERLEALLDDLAERRR